jgi:hypothetical protein
MEITSKIRFLHSFRVVNDEIQVFCMLVKNCADGYFFISVISLIYRYQCAYCFYRSCDFHIHTHHKLFHPLKSEVIYECKPSKQLDIEKEFSNAWKNVMNVCKPICCCGK